jgi:hypothetical protein
VPEKLSFGLRFRAITNARNELHMKYIDVLKRMVHNSDEMSARLREISELQHKSYDHVEFYAEIDRLSVERESLKN